MKTEYEYEIEIFELSPNADELNLALLIKNVLNKKGREHYAIVSVNEFGGFKSPKKVMYTLMREKKSYDEEPQFYKTTAGFIPPSSGEVKISSKVNRFQLPDSDTLEPDF